MAAAFADDPKVGPGYATLMAKLYDRFGRQGFNKDITLYRNFVLKEAASTLDVPERGKCDLKAAQLRHEGNRLYLEKKYKAALEKYNESICFAETGSDQLGIGFANRSAVYAERDEYEFALANIDLAKKHNYPEKLMSKVLARERMCRENLADGSSKRTVPCPRMEMNVNVNPKMPFVADGVAMKVYDKFGRGLIAEKDFRAGDVILDEDIFLATTTLETRYTSCGHCSADFNFNLIPCPGCVSTMYCNEKCREADLKIHRFECGIADKLGNAAFCSAIIGSKLFFYGLTVFDDDLEAMMDFCEGDSAKGVGDPFELDFTKKDLLEQFKVLQKAGVHHITDVDYCYRVSAVAFWSVFLKHPLLQQIVTTKKQRDFMLHTFLKYIRNCYALVLDWREEMDGRGISSLPFVGSICNHSCDPNAVFAILGGRFKLTLIRPVAHGEQITMAYGPTWWEPRPDYSSTYTCRCVVCDGTGWRINIADLPKPAIKHLQLIRTAAEGASGVNKAGLLNMVQQFVGRYARYHPNADFGAALKLYRFLLMLLFTLAERKLERGRAMAALER